MNTDPRAVGVLGGTFDPVHAGHVHVAEGVRRALALERVLLIPAAVPPHKETANITPARDRLAMVRAAVAGLDGLEVDPIEIERGGTSYTVETLRAMRARADRPLPVFVIGLDSLPDLPGWRDARALVEEFDLVVVDRPGSDVERIRDGLPAMIADRLIAWSPDDDGRPPLGRGGRIVHLPMATVDVASREIRARVAAGESPGGLVPPSVARYIQEHGLYRDFAGSASSPDDAEGGSTLTPEIAVCVAAARDKKAEDIVVLDLRSSDFTDYLLICHGTNDRQIRAIADSIEERLRKELGVKPSHIEGHRESSWVLMDYIDFVVHVFDGEKREFYRLERLWGDAPRIELPEEDETARRPGAATS